jgi:hypothetical protein
LSISLVLGILALVAAIASARDPDIGIGTIPSLAAAASSFFSAAIFYGAAEFFAAFRDIARNSFR